MLTVKGVEIEPTLRLALPETEVVRVLGVISRNHSVVRDSQHLLSAAPDGLHAVQALRVAVEPHFVRDIRARELPGVIVLQPRIGCLQLTVRGLSAPRTRKDA